MGMQTFLAISCSKLEADMTLLKMGYTLNWILVVGFCWKNHVTAISRKASRHRDFASDELFTAKVDVVPGDLVVHALGNKLKSNLIESSKEL